MFTAKYGLRLKKEFKIEHVREYAHLGGRIRLSAITLHVGVGGAARVYDDVTTERHSYDGVWGPEAKQNCFNDVTQDNQL